MDTPREPMFDNIVFTVAQLFRVRIAGLILVGDQRIFPKAEVGLVRPLWGSAAVLCRAVVDTGEPVMVEDAEGDPRFARVRSWEGGLRSCIAVPILGPDRQVIGTLGAFDVVSRPMQQRFVGNLAQLAEQASDLLQIRVPGLELEDRMRAAPGRAYRPGAASTG